MARTLQPIAVTMTVEDITVLDRLAHELTDGNRSQLLRQALRRMANDYIKRQEDQLFDRLAADVTRRGTVISSRPDDAPEAIAPLPPEYDQRAMEVLGRSTITP